MDQRSTNPDIERAFVNMGTSHLRLTVIGWTEFADEDWKKVKTDLWDEPFDWEWIPAWLNKNVDWSGEQPELRKARIVPGERP